jgi:outer membrane protein TolC
MALAKGIAHKVVVPGKGFSLFNSTRTAGVSRAALIILPCLLLLVNSASASSGSVSKTPFQGYFDFTTCVHYALVHSEIFKKNRLEIQIRSSAVKDAHAEIIPQIDIRTQVYLSRASGNTGSPLNFLFYTSQFNPFVALIKIKSNEILVDMAKDSHIHKITDHVAAMAKLFYSINTLEKSIKIRKQVLALTQDKVSYGTSKNEQGTMDPIQVRIWNNNLRGAQLKLKQLDKEREDKILELKALMGYPPDFHLPLDTRDAANQILGGFNGQLITFADVQGKNLSLKIAAKKEQVQSNMVTGAYVSLVPRPILTVEAIDNQVDRSSGFNLAVGVEYTVWDGFRKVREIKRQKIIAEQLKLDRNELSTSLYNRFKRLRGRLELSGEKEALVREQARLAELNEERALSDYKAGAITYDQYVDRRIEKVEAYLDALIGPQERVAELIDLATLAGGLNKYNARLAY